MLKIGDIVKLFYPDYYVIIKVTSINSTRDPYQDNCSLYGLFLKTNYKHLEASFRAPFEFYSYKSYKQLTQDEYIMEML